MMKIQVVMACALALSGCKPSDSQQSGTSGRDVANQLDDAADQSGPAARQVLESSAAEVRKYPPMIPVDQASAFTQHTMEKAGQAEAAAMATGRKQEGGR
jgi:hypothetical protein